MFKKVVSAIMVAAMVGTMVAPVSVSAKDGGKTIELWTCWTEGADTEKASQEMIQKWEEETGNTVNQTNFTYDNIPFPPCLFLVIWYISYDVYSIPFVYLQQFRRDFQIIPLFSIKNPT